MAGRPGTRTAELNLRLYESGMARLQRVAADTNTRVTDVARLAIAKGIDAAEAELKAQPTERM